MLTTHEITELLVAWSEGDRGALAQLVPIVEAELRRLAKSYLSRERPDHILQTTALIQEAYLRLIDWRNARWQNRAHFFGVAAQMMRRILVDYAVEQNALKRGGGARRVELDEAANLSSGRGLNIVDLDIALGKLSRVACKTESSGRIALLRRPYHERDRRGARLIARDGQA